MDSFTQSSSSSVVVVAIQADPKALEIAVTKKNGQQNSLKESQDKEMANCVSAAIIRHKEQHRKGIFDRIAEAL